jgi:uncharacterized membrane protein YhaH (DUF805 family)
MSFSQLGFSFNGRMRRRDFWIGQILLAFVVGFIVMILFPVAAMTLGIPRSGLNVPAYLGGFIRSLLLWPVLAIAVKRGHDRNRPAAWIIALYAIDAAVELFSPSGGAFRPWLMSAEFAFLAYVIVDLGVLEGSKGANRFGPPPKPPASTAEGAA